MTGQRAGVPDLFRLARLEVWCPTRCLRVRKIADGGFAIWVWVTIASLIRMISPSVRPAKNTGSWISPVALEDEGERRRIARRTDSAGHTPASLDGDARRALVCGEALAARSCQPELAPLRQEHQDSQGGREPGIGGHDILAQRNRARSPRHPAQHIAAAAATTTAEGLALLPALAAIWSAARAAHHWHANGAIDLVDLSIRDI